MSTEFLTRCRDFPNVWKKHSPGSLSARHWNGARLCRRPAAARGKFEGVGSLQRAAVGRGRHSRAPVPTARGAGRMRGHANSTVSGALEPWTMGNSSIAGLLLLGLVANADAAPAFRASRLEEMDAAIIQAIAEKNI